MYIVWYSKNCHLIIAAHGKYRSFGRFAEVRNEVELLLVYRIEWRGR